MTDTVKLLASWYGSKKVAKDVLAGRIGHRERAIRRAEEVAQRKPLDVSAVAVEPREPAPLLARAPARGEVAQQRCVAAPARDSLVAQALASMPELQRAWSRR